MGFNTNAELIDEIGYGVDLYASQHLYSLIDPGSEKYGAWEWRAARLDPGASLRRYVILAVFAKDGALPYNDEPYPMVIDLELRAGADNDHAFVKRVVHRSAVNSSDLPGKLENYWATGTSAAEDFTPDDLTELYRPPRV